MSTTPLSIEEIDGLAADVRRALSDIYVAAARQSGISEDIAETLADALEALELLEMYVGQNRPSALKQSTAEPATGAVRQ